jgi:hypothetical protein
MANAKKKDTPDENVVEEVQADEKPELTVVEKAEPVTMNRLQVEAEVNTRFRVTVKENVTPDQCLDEAFWAHLTTRLIPGDTLVVRPDSGSWQLELNVVTAGHNFVHVHEVSRCDLVPAKMPAKLPSLYKVEFAGPIHKWRFLRDGKMMRDGYATEALAQRAAHQHEMAVNRTTPK